MKQSSLINHADTILRCLISVSVCLLGARGGGARGGRFGVEGGRSSELRSHTHQARFLQILATQHARNLGPRKEPNDYHPPIPN